MSCPKLQNASPSSWFLFSKRGLFLLLLACVSFLQSLNSTCAYEQTQKQFPVGLEAYGTFNQHHQLPIPTPININQADVNQLLLLPYMNLNLALKIIKGRPFNTITDLNRLQAQGVPPRQLALLLDAYHTSSRPFVFSKPGSLPQPLLRQ
jgi:hypothetical protein